MTSQGERTATAMKILGRGGAALLPLFQQGGEGIRAAYADLDQLTGGINKGFAEAAHKAEQQLLRFHTVMGAFRRQLVNALLPAMTSGIRTITEYGSSLLKIVDRSNAGKIAMKVLGAGAVYAAVRYAILNAELVLTALAVLAAFLIIEDLYTLFTGGDSAIGKFIDAMFGVGASKKFVQDVKDVADQLWTALSALGPVLEAVAPLLKIVFSEALRIAADGIKVSIEATVAAVQLLVDLMFKAIELTGKVSGAVGAKVKEFGAAVGTTGLDALGDSLQGASVKMKGLADVHGMGDGAGYAPHFVRPSVPAGETAAGPQTVHQENRTNITIHGVKDAAGVSAGVRETMSALFEKEKNNAQAALTTGAAAEDGS